MTKELINPPQATNDEVDLIQLINMFVKSVKRLFQNLAELILWILIYIHNIITKYAKVWLVITVIAFTVALVFNFKVETKLLNIKTTLRSEHLRGIDFIDYINILNELIKLDDYEDLASRLKLSLKEAKSLEKISVGSIGSAMFEEIRAQEYASLDSAEVEQLLNTTDFYVYITLFRDSICPPISALQNSVVNYISSNEYLQNNYQNEVIRIKSRIKFTKLELAKVEKLDQISVDVIDKSIKTGSLSGDYVSVIDNNGNYIIRSDLLSQSLEVKRTYKGLADELQSLETQLRNTQPIRIISKFEKIKLKETPWIIEIKLALLIYGIVLGLILLKDFNSYIIRQKEKRLSNAS